MLLLPFLNDRRLGTIRKSRPFSCEWKPNLDFLISRLTCSPEDVFATHEQWYPAPPFACKFRQDRELELLTVSNEEGDIYLIDTDFKGEIVKKFRAHNNAIFDISWVPDKNQLLTGGGDFYCFLFDMNTYKKIRRFNYHSASVKTLDVCPANTNLFAAGSKDGSISIWDMRDNNENKPSVGINCAHVRIFNKGRSKHDQMIKSSVSSVAFKDEINLASTGVADSNIKIWDLRKTYTVRRDRPNQPSHPPVYRIDFTHTNSETFGFTSLSFDSLYSKLYACSSTNTIVQLDCHTYNKNNYVQYTGFRCSSYFVKMSLSSDDQYLLCGSSDHNAYVWNVHKPGFPIYELQGHSAEVTSVAWSGHDNNKLATCGDDMKVFLWKTRNFEDENCKAVKDLAGVACPYSKSKDDLYRTGVLSIKSVASSVTLIEKSKPNPKKRNSSTNTLHSFFSPSTTRHSAKKDPDNGSPPHSKSSINTYSIVPSTPGGCRNSISTRGVVQKSPTVSYATSSTQGYVSPPLNKSPPVSWPPEENESFLNAGYIITEKSCGIPYVVSDDLLPNLLAISLSGNVIFTRPMPDSDASTMSASSPGTESDEDDVPNVTISNPDISRTFTKDSSCPNDGHQASSSFSTITAADNICSQDQHDLSLSTVVATNNSCSKDKHQDSSLSTVDVTNNSCSKDKHNNSLPSTGVATNNSCSKDQLHDSSLPTVVATNTSCSKDITIKTDNHDSSTSTVVATNNSCSKDKHHDSLPSTVVATDNSCPKDEHHDSSPQSSVIVATDNSSKNGHHDSSPRLPLSPSKNIPPKFSPSDSYSPETKAGKENDAEKANRSGGASNVEKATNGGTNTAKKRKLDLKDRCRYHPEGCGRTRGGTRCGKKLVTPAKDNIKNYFIVTPKKP